MRALRLAALFACLSLVGCGDFGDEPAAAHDRDPVGPPPETVSFAADVQPIFDGNCVGCHGEGGNAGLDLRAGSSLANLVGVIATESSLARIEPGDPSASWLYLKLTGQQNVGVSMPPGDPLSADLTELVRTWIEEGALDN
ncbi:MAG TPA: hypothetical protein PLL30_01350 [Candidatus Krumholzibacteria bacterium]|nr:hypothetical protein [Candidatus Krumholzibacteria bacterium]HPD70409.1 hypothetical protein [Candidatus Krumholzibacteria bacterium]HRY39891.1 hypothetical protein [Candidatus Krumholzibacteria bacterium]